MTSHGEKVTQWGRCLKRLEYGLNIDEILKEPCNLKQQNGTEIQEFYRGAHVLITGATGFMGKIIVEKLLTSCPNIGKIYLLIRGKNGKDAKQRMAEIFTDSVFMRVVRDVPNYQEKLVALNGDCSEDNMGLTPEDYKELTELITIVFHGAATVKFNDKLHLSTLINVKGVREMLKFCKKCTKIRSILHISTAYTNCTMEHTTVEERFYEPVPNRDYRKIIDSAENEPSALDEKTESIISGWPNTYAFTKKLAEDMIQNEGKGLPISIFRPAIVVSSYKEPLAGWVDNINGPGAVVLGAYMGLIRVVYLDKKAKANLVPVDYAVNSIIAAAWKTEMDCRKGCNDITVYNYVSEARNPLKWMDFSMWTTAYGRYWPTNIGFWYPTVVYTFTPFVFHMLFFLLQTIPAFVADVVLFLVRKKPFVLSANKKIAKSFEVLSYFTKNHWSFNDDNVLNLWKMLSPEDQSLFQFNMADLDWDEHTFTHILGLRLHILKDHLDTLPSARKKAYRMKILHIATVVSLLVILFWIIFQVVN